MRQAYGNGGVEQLESRQLLSGGNLRWAFALGAAGADAVTAETTDAAGNVYVAGTIASAVDFNSSPRRSYTLTPTSGGDAFVAKYTADGALVWARLLGGAGGPVHVGGLGIDRRTGDVLVGGRYDGAPVFDSVALPAKSADDSNGFWARLSATTGTATFAMRAIKGYGDEVTQIETDAAGNVYLAGLQGAYSYWPSDDVMARHDRALVMKFNAKGRFLWQQTFNFASSDPTEDTAVEPIRQMAVAADGQVYVAGRLINGTLTTAGFRGGPGAYLLSYSPAGVRLFDRELSTGFTLNMPAIADLAVDAAGNVLAVGWFSGAIDFNGAARKGVLSAGMGLDGFLARYDRQGSLAYVQQIGAEGGGDTDGADSVAVDAEGYVYVGGLTSGTTYFSPTFKFVSTGGDGFVAKYNARGTFVTAWALGGSGGVGGVRVAAGPGAGGAVYVAGTFTGVLDANPGRRVFDLTSATASEADVFVMQLV